MLGSLLLFALAQAGLWLALCLLLACSLLVSLLLFARLSLDFGLMLLLGSVLLFAWFWLAFGLALCLLLSYCLVGSGLLLACSLLGSLLLFA